MLIAVVRDTRAIAMLDPDPDLEVAAELELVEIADAERDKFNRSAHYHLSADNATVEATPVVPPLAKPAPEMPVFDDLMTRLDVVAQGGDAAPHLSESVPELARTVRALAWLLRDSLQAPING